MTTRAQLAELDAVIADLKAHPKKHNQGAWMLFQGTGRAPEVTPALDCGSAFCIAGAVVARAGGQPRWYEITPEWGREPGKPITWHADSVVTPDGAEHSIMIYAQDLLGLHYHMADRLFSAYNTMEDIERIRDEIAATVSDED